ncbi:MAG: histidine phosphatase family protein [Microbacteriaceae bacterium]|nr:histidine phosphatase family protein [Microbacteriaceae bacterium]
MTTVLYLVRHGETDWNRAHRIQGLTDIPLNETGREQARETGRLLARRSVDHVVASPLSRAFETAQLIAREAGFPEPEPLPALVERDYGAAEGLEFEEVERRFPDRGAVPGQESRDAVAERVVPALERLAADHPDRSLVVVSHGGAIRAVLSTVDPDGHHGAITNGSVHSFRFDGETLHLVAFDDPLDEESVQPGSGDVTEQNAVEAREEGAA